MRYSNIITLPITGNAESIPWADLEYSIERWTSKVLSSGAAYTGCNLNPDFQRGHVWTAEQQSAYIEACLMNHPVVKQPIYINRGSWARWVRDSVIVAEGPRQYVLVDGKQRLNAILGFLQGEVTAFGHTIHEFEDNLPFHLNLCIVFGELDNRADVLRWYIGLNAGGTPHTSDEISRVVTLLEEIECM